jgi:hypothetical protein
MRALRRVLLPVFCILLVFTPAAIRAEGPLPSQLSDAEFWRFVSDASEAGGGFLSENFVSNELGYPYVIPALMQRARTGGAYIGVGPEQNFSYVVAVHPRIAFIVDIRRQNMIEHLMYKAVFELSANRTDFVSLLFARKPASSVSRSATPEELFAAFVGVPEDTSLYQQSLDTIKDHLLKKHRFMLSAEDESTLEHVYAEFAREGANIRYSVNTIPPGVPITIQDPAGGIRIIRGTVPPDTRQLTGAAVTQFLGSQFPTYADVMKATDADGRTWSYLSTEASYQAIRELQQKNLIVPLVGDFAGPKAIRAVGQYLKEHDAVLSTFYVSNVEQYLTPLPKLQSFYGNVATLPLEPSSTFIRSAQVQGIQPGLAQSSLSSIQTALDAVLEGRAQNWADILRLAN